MSTAKRQQEIYASYDEAEIFESELDYRVEQAKEEGEYSEVDGDSLCMVVYHHDSPCGESYTVFPDESLECILNGRNRAQRRGFTLKASYNGVKATKGDWSHEFDWDHTIAVVEGLYYETR